MPAEEASRQVHIRLAGFVAAAEPEMGLEIWIDESGNPFGDKSFEEANRRAFASYIPERGEIRAFAGQNE